MLTFESERSFYTSMIYSVPLYGSCVDCATRKDIAGSIPDLLSCQISRQENQNSHALLLSLSMNSRTLWVCCYLGFQKVMPWDKTLVFSVYLGMGTSAAMVTNMPRGWCPSDLIRFRYMTCTALVSKLADTESRRITIDNKVVCKILSSKFQQCKETPPSKEDKRFESNQDVLPRSANEAQDARIYTHGYEGSDLFLHGQNPAHHVILKAPALKAPASKTILFGFSWFSVFEQAPSLACLLVWHTSPPKKRFSFHPRSFADWLIFLLIFICNQILTSIILLIHLLGFRIGLYLDSISDFIPVSMLDSMLDFIKTSMPDSMPESISPLPPAIKLNRAQHKII